jgi:hypothetical protein
MTAGDSEVRAHEVWGRREALGRFGNALGAGQLPLELVEPRCTSRTESAESKR